MKKTIVLVITVILMLLMMACGSSSGKEISLDSMETGSGETVSETSAVETVTVQEMNSWESLEDILDAIDADGKTLINTIKDKYSNVNTSIGDSYSTYKDNYNLITDLFELIDSQSSDFFSRMDSYYEAYYKKMFEMYANDDKKLNNALDDIYDEVYSGTFDDLYDEIYSGVLDDLYDDYYSGLIDDAYDDKLIEYNEWSDATSKFYDDWSDADSTFYEKWSDGTERFYTIWSTMDGSLYSENRDYDQLMAEANSKLFKQAEENERKTNEVNYTIQYEIKDNKAIVVGYSGEGNCATISSSYEGCDVVAIADSAFEGCKNLQTVYFWADIESIGEAAFKDCVSLINISIPGETTLIGPRAFENCELLNNLIIWGNPVIGDYAFANCISLESISISSDTEYIGKHAFEGCTGVGSLVIWGVDEIGEYAFAGCTGIKSVSIPSGVKIIRTHSFDGCASLETVTVWGKDTKIEIEAFANCAKLNKKPDEVDIQAPREPSAADVKSVDNNNVSFSVPETPAQTDTGIIRPEIKEAIDSYETFITEYCEFMSNYNPSDFTMLTKYAELISKEAEMTKQFIDVKNKDLNDAENIYFTEVELRCTQKLNEVVISMSK